MRSLALVLMLVGGPAAAIAQPRWVRANFHAHAASGEVGDDGSETPAALHRAVRKAGFDFSVHTPHSTLNTDPHAAAHWLTERARESQLHIPGLTAALGEELTVAAGPNFQRHTQILGRAAPGNLDHLSLFGMNELIPSLTPLGAACDRVHEDGGICIVNHPGPGPMMWEEGLWEAPESRGKVDALEIYNGQAMSTVGIDFEGRYREATAYSGLGLKIAAVTGADTHGPRSVERARSRLAALGAVGKLIKMLLPGSHGLRPELAAATLVGAESASTADVIAAIKARRTIAEYGLRELGVECPGLGEVKHTHSVALALTLSRPVAEITLYREGAQVRSWKDARAAEWHETIDKPAAYVFGVRDPKGRLTTSAIWYEPR
ncbi:MAG TPA: hypothetical protein VII38_06855 [Polyangia bacterium]